MTDTRITQVSLTFTWLWFQCLMLTIDLEILNSWLVWGFWSVFLGFFVFLLNSQSKTLSMYLSMSGVFCVYFVFFFLSAYDGYTQQFITEDVD